MLVELDDVSVMFKRVADEPDAITRGMADVGGAVGLRGRNTTTARSTPRDRRRVPRRTVRESDDPEALGLEVGTLPGGRYARVRLTGEPPRSTVLMGQRFARLSRRPIVTARVPGIEFTGAATLSTCCCRSSDPADDGGFVPPESRTPGRARSALPSSPRWR